MLVTYNDKYLEAKAFPELFPYGIGSWYHGCGLTIGNYVKHRLLSYNERFRRNNKWSYFMFDRVIKRRLFYYSHALKLNVQQRDDILIFRELRINEQNLTEFMERNNRINSQTNIDTNKNCYELYRNIVPNTIPGCKSYWTSRLLNFMAMSRKLGLPTFFITFTQNDGWKELQTSYIKGPGNKADLINIDTILNFLNLPTKHCINNSVETCVTFNQRFDYFKKIFLTNNKCGPFGIVKDYWYRREYQKRGAIHIHMVIWCDTKNKKSVHAIKHAVTAEMPRFDSQSDVFITTARYNFY